MTNVHFTAWVMMILNHSPKSQAHCTNSILIAPSYGFLDLPDELIAKIFLDFWDSQPEMWLIQSRQSPPVLSYLNRRIRSILQDQAWINFFCQKYISREPSILRFSEIPLGNLVQHLNARYAKHYLTDTGVARPLAVMTGKRSLSLSERVDLVQLLYKFNLTCSFLFSHFGVLSSHLIEPSCLLEGMRLDTFSEEIKQLLGCYLDHPVAADLSDDDHCLALLDACLFSGSYSQLSVFRQASPIFDQHFLGQMRAGGGYAAFDVFTRRIINRYFPRDSLVGARESNGLSALIGGLVNYIHFWKCVSLNDDQSLLEKSIILSLYNFEKEKSGTRLYIHLANFVYLFYQYFLGMVSAETLISIFKQSDFRNEIFYLQPLLKSLFSFDLFSFFFRHHVFSELMYSFVKFRADSPIMFPWSRLIEVLDGFSIDRLDKRKIGCEDERLEASIVLSIIRRSEPFHKFDDEKSIVDKLNQSTLISIPNIVVDWLQIRMHKKLFAQFFLSLNAKPLKLIYHLVFSKVHQRLVSLKSEMSKILARNFDDFVKIHGAPFLLDLLGSVYLIDFSYQFIINFLSEEKKLFESNQVFAVLFHSHFQKYLNGHSSVMRLYFLWRCQSIWPLFNHLRDLNFSALGANDLYRLRRFDSEIRRVLLTQPHAMEKFLSECDRNQFSDIFRFLYKPDFYPFIYEIVKAIFSCFSNNDFPLERMNLLLTWILGANTFSTYLEVTEFNNIQYSHFQYRRIRDALVSLLHPCDEQLELSAFQLSLTDRLRLSLLFPDRANDFIFYQDLSLESLLWERLFTIQQEFRLYRKALLLQKKILLRALWQLSDAAGLQVLEFLLSEPGWLSNLQTREQVIEILLSVIHGFDKRRTALVMGSMYLFMKHDLFIDLVEYLRKNNKEDFFSYSFDVGSQITVSDLKYPECLFSVWFDLVLKLYEAWNREKGRFIFAKMLEYFIGRWLDLPINRTCFQLLPFPELFKLFLAHVSCRFRINRKDWTAFISSHPEKFNELIACLDVMSVLSHHFPDFAQTQAGSQTYSRHSFSILACLPFRLNVNQLHALVLANAELAAEIKVRIEASLRGRSSFSLAYLKLLAEYLCHHQVYLEQPELWQALFLSLKRWFENQRTRGCVFNNKPVWLDEVLSRLGAYRSSYPSTSNSIALNLQQCFFWCPRAERDPFHLEVPPRALLRFKLNGSVPLLD